VAALVGDADGGNGAAAVAFLLAASGAAKAGRTAAAEAAGIPRGRRRADPAREEAGGGIPRAGEIFSWDPLKLAPISTSWVG
jgi:hypothetical protein